jgi:hypothetical protein
MATFARPEFSIRRPQALPLSAPKWSVLYETDFRCLSDVRMFKPIPFSGTAATFTWVGGLSYEARAGQTGVYEFANILSPVRLLKAMLFCRAKPVAWDSAVFNYVGLAYAYRDASNRRYITLNFQLSTNNFSIVKVVGGTSTIIAQDSTPWGATPLNTELELTVVFDGSTYSATVKRLDTGASLTISASEATEYGYVGVLNSRTFDLRFDHFRVERL